MSSTVNGWSDVDQILMLERGALDRWGQGDPGGFLGVYAGEITYFDPLTAARIDGHQGSICLIVAPRPGCDLLYRWS